MMFLNVKSLGHRYTGATIFYGMSSHCIDVYGQKAKSEFLHNNQQFVTDVEAPLALRRDNAKEEDTAEVQAFNCNLFIKDEFSDPHNQQQNPVESGTV